MWFAIAELSFLKKCGPVLNTAFHDMIFCQSYYTATSVENALHPAGGEGIVELSSM